MFIHCKVVPEPDAFRLLEIVRVKLFVIICMLSLLVSFLQKCLHEWNQETRSVSEQVFDLVKRHVIRVPFTAEDATDEVV